MSVPTATSALPQPTDAADPAPAPQVRIVRHADGTSTVTVVVGGVTIGPVTVPTDRAVTVANPPVATRAPNNGTSRGTPSSSAPTTSNASPGRAPSSSSGQDPAAGGAASGANDPSGSITTVIPESPTGRVGPTSGGAGLTTVPDAALPAPAESGPSGVDDGSITTVIPQAHIVSGTGPADSANPTPVALTVNASGEVNVVSETPLQAPPSSGPEPTTPAWAARGPSPRRAWGLLLELVGGTALAAVLATSWGHRRAGGGPRR